MPLDSMCLAALREELEERVVGMRIDRIQQPERDALLLSLRGKGAAVRLMLCAGSGNARVHVTQAAYENPASPPMFCMLLRKHLTGARVTGIQQPDMERMLDIMLEGSDALGEPCSWHLIVELMGRYSNLILTGADGVILDCLRRVDYEMSEKRPVLPGLLYRLPPEQGKESLLSAEPETIAARLSAADGEQLLEKWLLNTFSGLSPLICRELAFRAYGDCEIRIFAAVTQDGGAGLAVALRMLRDILENRRFQPYMLCDGGVPKDFSFMEIRQYEGYMTCTRTGGFSELLDLFYTRRDKAERMRQRSQSLTKTVRNARDRTARKLELQRQELAGTAARETLRENGDIIKANLYAMEKGMTRLRAYDFYAPDGGEREIQLDPLKTPQQNAAKYYKDYAKAKNAEKYLTGQIAQGERELDYLNSVLEVIARAEGERDLSEIRQELMDTGYVKRQISGKKERRIEQKPLHFRASTGADIWVGRNNMQNDRLTLKTAMKRDIWLHTQKIHGSHVILACDGDIPDETALREAAGLAAYYSQARSSANVPVDYTQVRFVKKPSGARPGMVVYTDYRTLYVTPDESMVEKLAVR